MSNHISLNQQLQEYFGFHQFKEGQQQVIEHVISGHSSLAIFPTGSGKSLCYQLSAILLPHLTLVVSPLLALMKDQLEFLRSKGIPAAKIDSSLSAQEHQEVLSQIKSGQVKILMISVERFKNERFRQFIESVNMSLLVVDEAHCISEWAHNFRPDYLKLPSYQQALNIPQTLLLTATATQQVKQDMAQKFSIQDTHIVQTGFYRENLHLHAEYVRTADKPEAALKWIHSIGGSCIVYVTLQHQAEDLAAFLTAQKVNAAAYHAGMKDEKRVTIQQDFMTDKIQVIVATIAFGMGIDKSNIRGVIHFELPKSIESYSQEIGRAGRDGKTSKCVTLANLDGLATLENFVFGDTPQTGEIAMLLNEIRQNTENDRWETQLIPLSNLTNIRQLPLKTLLVQLELLGVLTPLFTFFAEFKFRFLVQPEDILSRFEGERQVFLQTLFDFAPVKSVWATLDVTGFRQAYQCDRTRLVAALEYLDQQNWIELQSQRATDVFAVNSRALEQNGLCKQLVNYFTDKENKEIARIHGLIEFFQTKSCMSSELANYFDDDQAPDACGYCHVCADKALVLPPAEEVDEPSQDDIRYAIKNLSDVLLKKLEQPVTHALSCRFLVGMSSPYLTRIRAKSISGYGLCSGLRYQRVKELVQPIVAP